MPTAPFEHIELKIMEAGFDRVDNSWNRFITFFPYYRIYYVVSGQAVIYLQNQQLNLKPGKLYFIPSFSIFDAHCDEILEHYWIHFNFDITTASYLTIYPPKSEAEAPPFIEKIFQKQFYTFKRFNDKKNNSQNSRVVNLLDMFELKDRLIANNSKEIYEREIIDYSRNNVIIQNEIQKSKKYLLESIDRKGKNIEWKR